MEIPEQKQKDGKQNVVFVVRWEVDESSML